MSITYTGWIIIFCIAQVAQIFFVGWLNRKNMAAIKNLKDQMSIDNRGLASLIATRGQ